MDWQTLSDIPTIRLVETGSRWHDPRSAGCGRQGTPRADNSEENA